MSGSFRHAVVAVVVAAALAFAAAASANLDATHTAKVAATAGDCNHNGIADTAESSWANRDDDADGVCNAVDSCPLEANPMQDSSACQMQAITVPFRPSDLSVPHPTYSGASTTLKGIARYGGNQYSWDFGDGSAPTPWSAITNPFNLGVPHVYTGAAGRLFIARLSVRNSASPAAVSTATYPVQVEQSSDLTNPAQLDVRARMAADQALWWLHVNETRSTYLDGSPGWAQPYGVWTDPSTGTCAAADAFENHGSKPGADWGTDPYVEDARRALAYILANGGARPIATQTMGNPDTNGNHIGVALPATDDTYSDGVCAIALADAGTPSRLAATGPANVYARRYADIAQDTVDWFAFGQNDPSSGLARGGWGYSANQQYAIGETFRWPVLAMAAAERGMGATVPAFVRQELPYFLNYSHYTASDSYNGAWGWQSPAQWQSVGFTAAGILIHSFLGDGASHPDVQRGLGFLYRHWNDPPASGVLFGNLGDSDAMWTLMRALQDVPGGPIARIRDFNYVSGTQTTSSFDWFHDPASLGRQGYAANLIQRQRTDGSWTDTVANAHPMSDASATAWDEMVISRGIAAQAPIADAGGPYSTGINVATTLDASRSVGSSLTYAWDLNGDGVFDDATGATATTQWASYTADANGVPLPGATPAKACVRVTDGQGLSDTACSNVTVKPPPHPPAAKLAGPVSAGVNVPFQLNATGSYDIDNDPLTFTWDLNNDGVYNDGTGSAPTTSFPTPGTFVVCVRVTDHPELNATPYGAPDTSVEQCTTVTVGAAPPRASAGGPYSVYLGASVTLDATASFDPLGDTLSYAWDLNGDGFYNDATSATPSLAVGNVPAGTVFTVGVRVTNSAGLSSTSYATVKVVAQPVPPVVVLVAPAVVVAGPVPRNVTLDGSRSYDPNGSPLTFSWTFDDPGATTGASTGIATHTFAHYGTSTAHLTVSNGLLSSSADATVTVVDRTPPAFTTVPADVTIEATASTTQLVSQWLASVTAVDDDPDNPAATLANDFVPTSGIGGVGVGNTVKVTWTATDGAGNQAQRSANVRVVDTTPPTLTLPGDQTAHAPSPAGAVVTFTASAQDYVSGAVPVTCAPASGATFPVGDTTVSCSATDGAGNTSSGSFVVTVIGDSTPPVITPTVDGPLGDNGWYTGDVHVTWAVDDPDSAVSGQTGCGAAGVTTDTPADGAAFTCTATSSGGTSSVTVRVKRDATPPTITAARAPAPNAAGWSSSDVTVTFTCADAGSGVAHCPTPAVLGEGAGQSASGTAADQAGNTATATVDHVNVDETPPTLMGSPTSAANINGWYRGDVTIHWACGDAASGIAGECPADSTISGEGTGLTATAHVADQAGNATSATSDPVKIDRTPPVTVATAPTGWTAAGVTVALSASDNLAGVAVTYYSLDGGPTAYGDSVAIDSEGRHTLTYWSVDAADNVETTRNVSVLIDRTAPTISHALSPQPNAEGWNNTDVSIGFTCDDALSGVSFCSPVQLLTTEGRAQPVVGTATDAAGNNAADTVLVSIDKTPPSIQASADRTPNADGWYKADVVVSFTCGDALSGVASCPGAVTVGEGSGQSVSRAARDAAGNATSASLGGLNVDETAPTVTYTGNAGTYTLAETVSITCAAADALSGVASSTCSDVSGPAWTFGLGTTSRTATAVDRAGNTGTGSTSFTVGVSCAGLKTLTAGFSTNAGVTASLDAKIDAICAAPNATAKSGKLAAFDKELAAQTGKAITAAQADVLAQFAAAL